MGRAEVAINHIQQNFFMGENNLLVLKDINYVVKDGEFVSIVGKSGCGKSTLLKIIAGLQEPTGGEVLVGGKKVERPSLNVGMIFQESRLYPWLTVEKNIEFGIHDKLQQEEKDRRIKEHIHLVNLDGFEKSKPKQLSGGMQQRVSIARTLVNRPQVLLLDEPFGALDALTRINMQNEILRIWRAEKTTMILVTHDIDEAIFLSDKIIIMSDKPGTIKKVISVGVGRPRDRSSAEFIGIRKNIFAEFFENTEIDIEYYI